MVPTMINCGTYIVSRKRDEIHRLLYEMIPRDDTYMHYRLSGTLLDVCTDVYFLAHENGEGLSRVWMCWGKHEGAVSNWGAVFTKEEHRGRGLCRIVLDHCFAELDRMQAPPPALFCTAGPIAKFYAEYGFVPAIAGRTEGPLYCPRNGSPATFRDFCEEYYTAADELRAVPADFGRRNEIDCLLRFALVDRGIPFGIGEERDLYPILMKSPERAKMLLTPDGKTVGWMCDGKVQVHPTYEKAQIIL